MQNLKVVHANELVEASYALSIDEMRLIALASTKYDSRKPNLGSIKVHVKEYIDIYKVENKNVYANLKRAVNSIMTKPIRIYDPETNEIVNRSWLLENRYTSNDDGSYIQLTFSPLIEPYLFELKSRFTSIDFEYAARLNTPFSFRLYQWLKKVEYLKVNTENKTKFIQLKVEWMKSQAAIKGRYNAWRDFNKRVVSPAVDKINEATDLYVIYEPILVGRKVDSIKFVYINQKDKSEVKPVRPRLKRRPKVLKSSHEEGQWMKQNLALLLKYKSELISYDPQSMLSISDLKKVVEYSVNGSSLVHQKAKLELKRRTKKKV